MSVAAVVLAAGASSRFGSPKQLATIGGETLLERAVRVASYAGCRPVIVVLGAEANLIRDRTALGDAVVVVNDEWAGGMGGSIRAGVDALGDVEGCVVMTCDMLAVTSAHLRALMSSCEVTASSYAGRSGVPAYFPASAFPELSGLQGDVGAREMLRSALTVELKNGELDLDTIESLERARVWFA